MIQNQTSPDFRFPEVGISEITRVIHSPRYFDAKIVKEKYFKFVVKQTADCTLVTLTFSTPLVQELINNLYAIDNSSCINYVP